MQFFSKRKTSIKASPKDTFQPAIATNMKLRNDNSVLGLFLLFMKKRLNIYRGQSREGKKKNLCCYFQGLKCFSPPKVFVFTKMVARELDDLREYF